MADTPSPLIDNHREPEDIMKTMSDANMVLTTKLGKAITQLKANREQFQFYADNHAKKGTPDGDEKAATNFDMVNQIDMLVKELTI